ncbi:hypothetical protein AC1031_006448 [Aphanomyces cochlioides]|nr:hypothetical protein AC1031_006448 [Aphanomyces cochlioides]
MAEKKQLEHELRRQSQQFREVVEERDADVQIEYNKMLSELNDHLEDAKQQLDSAIQLRDSKLDLVKDIPSTSHSLATEADLHEYQKLQRQVIARTNEVNELQAEFQALEEELARPLKRKADVLESIPDAQERDAEECTKLQEEIKLLAQTEVNLKDQVRFLGESFCTYFVQVNQRRLLDIQRAENEKMQREIQEVPMPLNYFLFPIFRSWNRKQPTCKQLWANCRHVCKLNFESLRQLRRLVHF